VLRDLILAASRNEQLKGVIEGAPVTSAVVRRFVAGEQASDAVEAVRALRAKALLTSIDHLGEDVLDREMAANTVAAYRGLLDALAAEGLADGIDLSVKLSAVGQALPGDGEKIALENARSIAAAASHVGATITLDMEDHTTTDSTLSILRDLRQDFPWVGAVLQSYLYRTEADCRDLAYEGSRVRLCKGAYKEPASVAFQARSDVDRSYVRCLRILMNGAGYPMIASHDPRLIEIAGAFVVRTGRPQGSYEYQMLYGIRPEEQTRLADRGERVRVYLPYGTDWYGYFMRRLAERPANVAFFLRSLATRN
jgi:proline dehydrogenase